MAIAPRLSSDAAAVTPGLILPIASNGPVRFESDDSSRPTLSESARFGSWPSDFLTPINQVHENPRKTAILAGSVLGLILVDPWIQDALGGAADGGITGGMADGLSALGDRRTVVLVLAGLTTFGYINRRPYLLRSSFLAIESALITSFWVELGKCLTGRERPAAANGDRGRFHGPDLFQPESRRSFPSGHAAAVFALGTVAARRYPGWPGRVAYGLSGGVAMSRVLLDRHWFSDVFLGSLLGYIVADAVVDSARRPGTEPADGTSRWELRLEPAGISVSRSF